MTRKIAISVPDDVADRLERESNVSAFIAETVRWRMVSERVRHSLTQAGFAVSEKGIADARAEFESLHAGVTPELREAAAKVRARIAHGQPE